MSILEIVGLAFGWLAQLASFIAFRYCQKWLLPGEWNPVEAIQIAGVVVLTFIYLGFTRDAVCMLCAYVLVYAWTEIRYERHKRIIAEQGMKWRDRMLDGLLAVEATKVEKS